MTNWNLELPELSLPHPVTVVSTFEELLLLLSSVWTAVEPIACEKMS